MDIRSLGYLRFESAGVEQWRTYALDTVGYTLGTGPNPDALYLRIDDRPARVVISPGAAEKLAVTGWEVRDRQGLRQAVAELEAAGYPVKQLDAATLADRGVEDGVTLLDPAGNVLEIFYGPALDHSPVVSKYGDQFLAEDLGLGHIVIPAASPEMTDADATFTFYTEVLGFRLRDSLKMNGVIPDLPEGTPPLWIRFLGCNTRHHSVALFPFPNPANIVHFMLEVDTLDGVGRALDRHLAAGTHISSSLGRHVNDHMVSFYARTPGGWDLEVGTGARLVDDSTWTVKEITQDAYWGHAWGGTPTAS